MTRVVLTSSKIFEHFRDKDGLYVREHLGEYLYQVAEERLRWNVDRLARLRRTCLLLANLQPNLDKSEGDYQPSGADKGLDTSFLTITDLPRCPPRTLNVGWVRLEVLYSWRR